MVGAPTGGARAVGTVALLRTTVIRMLTCLDASLLDLLLLFGTRKLFALSLGFLELLTLDLALLFHDPPPFSHGCVLCCLSLLSSLTLGVAFCFLATSHLSPKMI